MRIVLYCFIVTGLFFSFTLTNFSAVFATVPADKNKSLVKSSSKLQSSSSYSFKTGVKKSTGATKEFEPRSISAMPKNPKRALEIKSPKYLGQGKWSVDIKNTGNVYISSGKGATIS